jgi:hypothetical protein
MSLDISKLENVRMRGDKTIARCPACAEAGHDEKCEHLVINADRSFGCVVYPGDSEEAKEHRRRIVALCGDRKIKPLSVHPAGLGRLGRPNQSQLAGEALKTGLLGRLGRRFQTHLETGVNNNDTPERQLDDSARRVLGVLKPPDVVNLHRRVAGNDEYILQDRDGDYVENVESGDTETVKMHFTFTKDIAKAKRFTYDDLWSPLATTSIGGEFTHGFGGGKAIKVSGR